MIYSILILVCFVSIFLFQMREKNRITPLTVFCSIWIITIFLYSLGLYNIYSISEKAYILLFLGLVLFCLGYVCMKHIKIKHIII